MVRRSIMLYGDHSTENCLLHIEYIISISLSSYLILILDRVRHLSYPSPHMQLFSHLSRCLSCFMHIRFILVIIITIVFFVYFSLNEYISVILFFYFMFAHAAVMFTFMQFPV